MTGLEFRNVHGDPAQWDDNEYEAFQAWAAPAEQPPAVVTIECWFCSAPTPATATRCSFCCHHTDDAPTAA